MTPEQLISDLQKLLGELQMELTQAQADIKDFEELAIVWKKSYGDMERNYRIKLANAEQTIQQLNKELEELKNQWIPITSKALFTRK